MFFFFFFSLSLEMRALQVQQFNAPIFPIVISQDLKITQRFSFHYYYFYNHPVLRFGSGKKKTDT